MDTFAQLWSEVTATLMTWGETFASRLPHLLLALLILVASVYIGRLARSGLGSALSKSGLPRSIRSLSERMLQGLILIVAVMIGLGLLDLDKPLTSLLAGAGVAGLAVGFAFQHTAANFIASVTLAMRRPYQVGDLVEVAGVKGRVAETDLRVTRIRTLQGQDVRIPNKQVIEDPIINYSTGRRRIDLECGVGYGDDLDQVLEVTHEALSDVKGRIEDEAVKVFFTGFGGSSINLVAQIWLDDHAQPDFLAGRSEAIVRLKKAYDEAGINIPFPIRTLELSSAMEPVVRLMETEELESAPLFVAGSVQRS